MANFSIFFLILFAHSYVIVGVQSHSSATLGISITSPLPPFSPGEARYWWRVADSAGVWIWVLQACDWPSLFYLKLIPFLISIFILLLFNHISVFVFWWRIVIAETVLVLFIILEVHESNLFHSVFGKGLGDHQTGRNSFMTINT